MPLGCFGPSSAEAQLVKQLDQAKTELSAKEREFVDLKRRHEEAAARQVQAQRVANGELERNVNLLRQQVEELTTALQVKERETSEVSDKLKAALAEAADAKRQLEDERAAARSAEQAKANVAAAQARIIAEYEKQLQDSQAGLQELSQELATAQKATAEASAEASAAREDVANVREQLARALAEQAKAIADAEDRAAAVAQEAAASTVALAAEMAEKAAVANRQHIETLRAELAAQEAKLSSVEQAAAELPLLRRQAQDAQQQLAAAQAELGTFKELRRDLSERLAELQMELENANLVRQSLETERQMLAEQLEQVTVERGRLETQVQELEGTLLENALDAVAAASAPDTAVQVASRSASAGGADRASQSAGCADADGEDNVPRLASLGANVLAAQLMAAQEEAHELRKELERTIIGHAEEEEAVQAANERLKCQVEDLTVALAAAESRIHELEALRDELSTQLGGTQVALEEARNTVEALRQEMVALELDRAELRSRGDEAQAEVAKLQQQLKEAQMRAVELVSANADLQVEQAKLRSEVLSQGLLSDSNTQMTSKLLTDYQALKDEHARLRGELRRKDEMMALLQEQLSSLTEIDLDSMLRQIDSVQTRKPAKKSVVAAAAPVEAMLAAAGLAGKQLGSYSAGSGSNAGTPSAARAASAGANGNGALSGGPEMGLEVGPSDI